MREQNTPSGPESLIRTIAGASRKLDKDLTLSKLQAIDKLQKLDTKFREYWVGHPWLVLEDCYCLPAHMSEARMLRNIEEHGLPIGIVGVALLPGLRGSILRMQFRADKKSRETVERSAKTADEMFKQVFEPAEKELAEKVRATKLHDGGSTK